MITVEKTDSTNTDFLALVADLDKDLYARYGDLQKEYEQFNELADIDNVIVAYHDTIAAGCGCFKRYNETTVELKRVFVTPESRNRGMATQVITELENWATQLGFLVMILETGDMQPESVNLYEKLGFTVIPNYREFIGMEHSICMQKPLEATLKQF